MTERMQLVDICVRRKSDDKFLLVTNRKYGGYTTPGGKVDSGEHHEAAALRELKEETGLIADVGDISFVGFFEHSWRDINVRCFGYWCWLEDLEGDQQPQTVEEGTVPSWGVRDDLLDYRKGCLAPAYYGWLMAKLNWDNYDGR